jgi:hypothetical protein
VSTGLDRDDILRLFDQLSAELSTRGARAEIFLAWMPFLSPPKWSVKQPRPWHKRMDSPQTGSTTRLRASSRGLIPTRAVSTPAIH